MSKISSTCLTDNILKCMTKEAKKPLGKAGLTYAEAQAQSIAKSEREMQEQIQAFCDSREPRWPCYRQAMHKRTTGRRGQPDFLICVPFTRWLTPYGRFVAIECKMKGNVASREQLDELAAIRQAAGITLIAYSAKEAIDFLIQLSRV